MFIRGGIHTAFAALLPGEIVIPFIASQGLSLIAQTGSNGSAAGGIVGLLLMLVFAAIGIGALVLWIYALINAIKNPKLDSNMRLVWVLVIVLVGPIGAIIYLIAGR
jgi:uncharacterized membrane protein